MKIHFFKFLTIAAFLLGFDNLGIAQTNNCNCTSNQNLSFYNDNDIECAIICKVNSLLNPNSQPKCLNEKTVNWNTDGMVSYTISQGTVYPYSQDLFNAIYNGVFNGNCLNSAQPVTPSKILAFANAIVNKIQSLNINSPYKVTAIRNLAYHDVSCCANLGCAAYEFTWEYKKVKCTGVEIPNKN
jgi:hypothetical protein